MFCGRLRVIPLLIVAAVATTTTSAQTETAKLQASDGAAADQFGKAAAVDGDLAIIGAPADDHESGFDSGSVYVFRRITDDEWVEEAKLLASNGGESFRFGQTVAISGEVAAIGSGGDNGVEDNTGRVYIVRRAGEGIWTEEAILLASDGEQGDQCGDNRSLAIEGDIVLVGAIADDDNA